MKASNLDNLHKEHLTLYFTPAHPCAYLKDHQAITTFIDPFYPNISTLYSFLIQQGFRRSGEFLYHPQCHSCEQCISVRIPAHAFQPNRIQRRIWLKNQDLTVFPAYSDFKQEHFELYNRYLDARHKGGGMDNPTPYSYMHFLTCYWAYTVFYEFRLQDKLVAVAVVDILNDGLSAIYTFFDPDYDKRSLGVYAILWEIAESQRLGLEWLYLGYWIKDSQKMSYKTNYFPLEYYYKKNWQTTQPIL